MSKAADPVAEMRGRARKYREDNFAWTGEQGYFTIANVDFEYELAAFALSELRRLGASGVPWDEFIEHIQWKRGHAHERIEQTYPDGITKGTRCIPVNSPLNAYLQGERDACDDLLTKAKELTPAPPEAEQEESNG